MFDYNVDLRLPVRWAFLSEFENVLLFSPGTGETYICVSINLLRQLHYTYPAATQYKNVNYVFQDHNNKCNWIGEKNTLINIYLILNCLSSGYFVAKMLPLCHFMQFEIVVICTQNVDYVGSLSKKNRRTPYPSVNKIWCSKPSHISFLFLFYLQKWGLVILRLLSFSLSVIRKSEIQNQHQFRNRLEFLIVIILHLKDEI